MVARRLDAIFLFFFVVVDLIRLLGWPKTIDRHPNHSRHAVHIYNQISKIQKFKSNVNVAEPRNLRHAFFVVHCISCNIKSDIWAANELNVGHLALDSLLRADTQISATHTNIQTTGE